ncbi:MAG TPA: hypothetical protein ENH45_02080 [Nitrospirae bacterium]|nr:hypothetical protein BMS3Abin10_01395 [bacterium BMS3Abin10]GBE39522.1 hypothetical protein BMS3Bbin08_02147 [bacterium BMS3Bbin08]HDZ83981.1 hypothetical protein [Nitrospirota bacterium]
MLNPRRICIHLCLYLVIIITLFRPLYASETATIRSEELTVQFEEPLRNAAKEIADVYPYVKAELEQVFGPEPVFRPTVVIIKDEKAFQKMTGSKIITAFAVPQKNLIVIDSSKMSRHLFSTKVTLKHELCHLFLHYYVKEKKLPKWLNEGISQWVSGGIAEIMTGDNRDLLKQAALSGRFISLRDLSETFPANEKYLVLAYEQSRSIVEYIDKEFGTAAILEILDHIGEGNDIDTSVQRALAISAEELENRWHGYLRKKTTWFTYLSNNLYTILFSLAGVLTFYGFVRLLIRKRAYRDEDQEDSTNSS